MEYYKKALDIYLTKLGDMHPRVAELYNEISSIYLKMKKKDLAIKLLNKSYTIYKNKFGNNHTISLKIKKKLDKIKNSYK